MKKSIALLIVAILVLPALSIGTPVRASTGHPIFGYMDGGNLTIAMLNETLKAGTMEVYAVDGTTLSSPGNFTIVFTYNGTLLVDFSGAGFDLYMSKDYYSSLSADDKMYASGFVVNDLNLTALKQVNVTNPLLKGGQGTFYIGTVISGVPAQVLVGPIPFDITNNYKYIKVFDGSGTLVAVAGIIQILPSISLTPMEGPGGANVCLTGVALSPSTVYNITYSNSTTAAAQVTTGTDGKFTFCWNIKDLCEDWELIPGDSTPIEIDIIANATGTFIDQVTYTEYARVILNLVSPVDDESGPMGNLTGYLDVFVLNDLNIEGNWFNPSAPVNVIIGGATVATFNTNATGYFNETITVPILTVGDHNVTLSNAGCTLIFTINVLPTLILTPEEGPIGTIVTATAYGFPANSFISLYWEDDSPCSEYEETNIVNATTGADGQFNVTVTFAVPAGPGGYHDVDAWNGFAGTYEQIDDGNPDNLTATVIIEDSVQFYVTPTLFITPSTINNNGTTFWVNGTGLDPYDYYLINLDNHPYAVWFDYVGYFGAGPDQADLAAPFYIVSGQCGDLAVELVAAGFYPGLHSVSLEALDGDWDYGFYPIDVYTTFHVSAAGDLIIDNITNYINTTNNAKLVSIENDIATISTDVGTLKTSVAALDAKVTSLQGNVATVQTTLGTLQGTVTSISGDMATVKTQVGTINANVASIKSFLPVDMMPVWIAVIFAIIAAIASIYGVLVIRSKIAQ